MKKLLSILTALSMLFLCACSGQSGTGETTTSASTTSAETAKTVKFFTEWGTDKLPAEFPAPPENAHSLTVSTGKASDTGYRTDWVRLKFTCTEEAFYTFSNALIELGYIGGVKNIASPSTYFLAGFNGGWQNGENLVRINNAEKQDNNEITFTVDILGCTDTFPDELEKIFPKFDGYTKSGGMFYLYNEAREVVSHTFDGAFGNDIWHWDFGFENAFIGVTANDLSEYEAALVEAGFAGKSANSTVDGCTVISYDLVKETEKFTYGVFMVYNQTLRTLDIVYTNDIELVIGKQS